MAGGGDQGSARGLQPVVRRRTKKTSDSSDVADMLNVVGLSPGETSLSLSPSDLVEGRRSVGGVCPADMSGSDVGLDQVLEGHSQSSESSAASEKIVLQPPVKMAHMGSPPPVLPPPLLEEPFGMDMDEPPTSPPPDIEEDRRRPVPGTSEWAPCGTAPAVPHLTALHFSSTEPVRKFIKKMSLSYVFDKLKVRNAHRRHTHTLAHMPS